MTSVMDALDVQGAGARASAVQSVVVPPRTASEGRKFVLRGLADDDFFVRRAVSDAIGRFGPAPGVVGALSEACRDDQLSVRSAAFSTLSQLGTAAITPLASLMGEEHAGHRRFAAEALGAIRDAESRALLVGHLKDESAAVRGACVDALGSDAAANPAGAVMSLLKREQVVSVQMSCLLALAKLDAVIDLTAVRPFLDNPLTHGPAISLLAKSGDFSSVESGLADTAPARRLAALAALGGAFARRPQEVLDVASRAVLAADVVRPGLGAGSDEHVRGVLVLAGAKRNADWFAAVARRDDRHHHAGVAHSVVAFLKDPRFARELVTVARRAEDEAVRAFMVELSTAVLQRESGLPVSRRRATLLDTSDYDRLTETFQKRAGLKFGDDAAYRVESRLLPRLRATGVSTFRSYVDLLRSDTAEGERELLRALDRVTIHETYFFREVAQLKMFQRVGLPHLCGLRRRPLRVLSAGCASGEEAYTIAMLMHEERTLEGNDIEVLGVDISENVLETARSGVYGRRGLRGDLPPVLKSKYLKSVAGDQMEVASSIRARVSFERMNLSNTTAFARLPRFHAIFCRNVLIYLTPAARQRIIESFYEQLLPGGLLLLGHSESLLNTDTQFRFVTAGRDLLYVRPLADGSVPQIGEPRRRPR